ncbi:ferredoxin [Candidatus Marinamargulisbacteria bacterium SCGC AG-414-C22]|nr:ferredoxin [Candidatus Marinamargulisbacteria bacterium SCGC AG-414-C22]
MTEFIYEENVQGLYYVNDDCISCDTCHDLAPNNFKLTFDFDHAYVCKQPENKQENHNCKEALDMCPVAAIRKRDDSMDS